VFALCAPVVLVRFKVDTRPSLHVQDTQDFI